MPVEIRELNIKAYVDDSSIQSNSQTNNSTDNNNVNNIETIVKACVEQVLQILKDKEER